MKNNTPETTIHAWIESLIKNKANFNLINPDFIREDGMSLKEYLQYEQSQFSSLSSIYDLDKNFSIKILYHNIDQYFFYIINKLNKIVCKMSITLTNQYNLFYISGNNFNTQLVPKYRFNYNEDKISHISLAIKSPLKIEKIICPELSVVSLSKGDNFNNDGFYHALFECDENKFNRAYSFHLYLTDEQGSFIEKRQIFFDNFDKNLIPFEINDYYIKTKDENYPVHLSYWTGDINTNHEYPRQIQIKKEGINKITITDSLDNDWVLL